MTLKILESRCPKGYHANFGLSSSFSLSCTVHQCGKSLLCTQRNTADNLLRALYEPTRELTLKVSWLQVKSDM